MRKEEFLRAIESEFLNDEGWKKTTSLSRENVRQWMHSDDFDVLEAAYHLLFFKEHWPRVTPPLSFDEAFAFRKKYYARSVS